MTLISHISAKNLSDQSIDQSIAARNASRMHRPLLADAQVLRRYNGETKLLLPAQGRLLGRE